MSNLYSTRLLALEHLRDEMRILFDELDSAAAIGVAGGWSPALDVCETHEALVVRVEVPGVEADGLEVTVVGGHLKISGSKPEDAEPGTVGRLCLERASGTFCRVLRLGRPVDTGAAAASLRDGVLTVTLPKLPDRRRTEIKIPITLESADD